MKKFHTLLAVFIIASMNMLPMLVVAQSPEKVSYQAVIRDSENHLVINTSVGMQLSILPGSETGTPVYTETHTANTNMNGLVTIEIGTGITSDDFSAIDWADGPYFIKTETDPAGGNSYTITGTSQLLSVPYALYAKTAGETDPQFELSVAGGITAEDTTRWGVAETDPLFTLSLASKITADDTTRWNNPELPLASAGNIITYDGNNWLAKDLVLTTSSTGGGSYVNNMQPSLVLNYCICLNGLYPSRNSMEPFIGEIQLFAFNFAPRNFAYCSGQLMSIAENTALFSLVGTYYGGDGRTTFGLPDLRGRTPVSWGTGPGLTPRSIGQVLGYETTRLSVANLPSHEHTVNISFED